jgi:hypothetical protein
VTLLVREELELLNKPKLRALLVGERAQDIHVFLLTKEELIHELLNNHEMWLSKEGARKEKAREYLAGPRERDAAARVGFTAPDIEIDEGEQRLVEAALTLYASAMRVEPVLPHCRKAGETAEALINKIRSNLEKS